MDRYTKMCGEARQLQKLWKPKVGDHVWRRYTFFNEEIDKQIWNKREEIIILTYASDVDGYFHATKDGETRIFNSHNEAHKATCVWLPTQRQLQGSLKKPLWWLVWHFEEFVEPMSDKTFFQDTTMDELWLAFVMKEKYNRMWDRKTWIKGT